MTVVSGVHGTVVSGVHGTVVSGVHGTVVLAAHGTRDPAGVAVARQLVRALRARLPGAVVRLGFVDVLGPSVREVVADAPGPVTVVPAFLACGYHVRIDVPDQVAATGRRDVTITAALGPDPLVVRALADRLHWAGLRGGDAVVLAAAGSSDPRAVADVRLAAGRLSGLVDRPVRVGFVAAGEPRIRDLVACLRTAGAHRVAVASWLLAPGLFHRKLSETASDVLAPPLGAHPCVIDRLVHLVRVTESDSLTARAKYPPPRRPGTSPLCLTPLSTARPSWSPAVASGSR